MPSDPSVLPHFNMVTEAEPGLTEEFALAHAETKIPSEPQVAKAEAKFVDKPESTNLPS